MTNTLESWTSTDFDKLRPLARTRLVDTLDLLVDTLGINPRFVTTSVEVGTSKESSAGELSEREARVRLAYDVLSEDPTTLATLIEFTVHISRANTYDFSITTSWIEGGMDAHGNIIEGGGERRSRVFSTNKDTVAFDHQSLYPILRQQTIEAHAQRALDISVNLLPDSKYTLSSARSSYSHLLRLVVTNKQTGEAVAGAYVNPSELKMHDVALATEFGVVNVADAKRIENVMSMVFASVQSSNYTQWFLLALSKAMETSGAKFSGNRVTFA